MNALFKVLLSFLLLLNIAAFAQCPPNIGFEDGTFNHWQCFVGNINKDGSIDVTDLGGPISGRHTIISTNEPGRDPYGHFPAVCPNGSKYSIKLGNDDTSHQAERVTYTYKVPPGQEATLILNYAVVLQNPTGHEFFEQPRFTAKIYDVTDDKYISCPSFDFIASNLPGFKLSDVQTTDGRQSATSIYYKDWSSTTINLVGYGGKEIRLEFTTNDCSKGGHFGYAYLDLDENCTAAIGGNTYCTGQPAITLYAPTGFDNYLWYNASDLTKEIGSGPTLTLSPAPPDQSKYAVIILPYPGLGCVDTLYTTINKVGEGFKFNVANTVYGCKATGADLTAAAVTAGSDPGMIYSYYTDAIATNYLYNPGAAAAGTYYIRGINPAGCMNILPVKVILVDQPDIGIKDPLPVHYPQSVDLSAVYIPKTDQTYGYYTDASVTMPLTDYKHVNVSGKYYIKAVNSLGCETISSVNVVINPPLKYTISAPNVFTPNNDGINDYFSIRIDGFASFVNLKIYNRYGMLIFTAKSAYELWDGNYKGKALPPGSYYWIFEGEDQYYHTKITKAGPIVIAR